MDLRCNKRFTMPSPYKTYEDGKVYAVDVEKYDVKKHPWLKFFDPPAEKPKPAPKGKGDEGDDPLK